VCSSQGDISGGELVPTLVSSTHTYTYMHLEVVAIIVGKSSVKRSKSDDRKAP